MYQNHVKSSMMSFWYLAEIATSRIKAYINEMESQWKGAKLVNKIVSWISDVPFLCFYMVLLRHWITITFTCKGVGLIWCDHQGQEYNAKNKFRLTLYSQIRLGRKVTTRFPLCITMCLLLQQECTMSKFWSFSFFSNNHRCSDLDAHSETSAYHR